MSPLPDAIEALSFDVGGTLIVATPSVGTIYSQVCRAHGIDVSAAACDRLFDEVWARRSASVEPGRDRFSASPGGEEGWWRAVVHEVLDRSGASAAAAPSIEAFRSAFADPSAWRLLDGVRETLAALRASGYRLVVTSNWDSRLPALLSRLGLDGYFEAILCSALRGVEKPDARLFLGAAEALGVPPGRILHVGDEVRADYHGARASGMAALLLDLRGRPGIEGVDPRHVVRGIPEIPGRLGGRPGRADAGSPA